MKTSLAIVADGGAHLEAGVKNAVEKLEQQLTETGDAAERREIQQQIDELRATVDPKILDRSLF